MTTCLTPDTISTLRAAVALGPRLQLEVAAALGAAAAFVDSLEDPEIGLELQRIDDSVLLYVTGADGKAQTTALLNDSWRTQNRVVATALSTLFGPTTPDQPHAPHGADLDAVVARLMELRREYLSPLSSLVNAGLAAGYLCTALALPAPRITETSFIVNLAWDLDRHTALDVECVGDLHQPYEFTASNSRLRRFVADDAATPATICAQVRELITASTAQTSADAVCEASERYIAAAGGLDAVLENTKGFDATTI